MKRRNEMCSVLMLRRVGKTTLSFDGKDDNQRDINQYTCPQDGHRHCYISHYRTITYRVIRLYKCNLCLQRFLYNTSIFC